MNKEFRDKYEYRMQPCCGNCDFSIYDTLNKTVVCSLASKEDTSKELEDIRIRKFWVCNNHPLIVKEENREKEAALVQKEVEHFNNLLDQIGEEIE